jgi:hypothetical protein
MGHSCNFIKWWKFQLFYMEVKFKKKKNVSKIQAEGILLRDVPDETK